MGQLKSSVGSKLKKIVGEPEEYGSDVSEFDIEQAENQLAGKTAGIFDGVWGYYLWKKHLT